MLFPERITLSQVLYLLGRGLLAILLLVRLSSLDLFKELDWVNIVVHNVLDVLVCTAHTLGILSLVHDSVYQINTS